MLFNSYIFLFAFLPLTLLVYHGLRRSSSSNTPALFWLVIASLFYYGWWAPEYLLLLAASVVLNYSLGRLLINRPSKLIVTIGVILNLAALGYFKYANFFVSSLNSIGGSDYYLAPIILPLAISFFTFQQIAFLVDSHRGEVRETNFLHYCLFVCFFPQLLSGPIVHHREMMPQFAGLGSGPIDTRLLEQGVTLFAIGLFKKVIMADSLGLYADKLFGAAAQGAAMTGPDALLGSVAFTLQLYFDFSGYSDIAVGLAAMMGIRLIFNFNSPHQATSIIEFWRRWHMSLSRFLRDYLYFALGGNRYGPVARYSNLFITMFLGGLWHGAAWNFAIWGSLHGLYLMINHAWRHMLELLGWKPQQQAWYRASAWLLCFMAVALALVIFRAPTLSTAAHIFEALLLGPWDQVTESLHRPATRTGFGPIIGFAAEHWSHLTVEITLIAAAFALIILCPASQVLVGMTDRAESPLVNSPLYRLRWKSSMAWALITATLLLMTIMALGHSTEFVYFQF